MKKVLIAAAALIVLLAAWKFQHGSEMKYTACQKVADAEVQHELADMKATFRSSTLIAMAGYCKKDPVVHQTPSGTFWTTCAIAGEFVDPATYNIVENDNKTILPTGVYMRLENAAYLLKQGYTVRNIDLCVYAWAADPTNGKAPQIANAVFSPTS